MSKTLLKATDFYDIENVFRKTPEGFLTGKICVTGIGVFSYMTDNGIKKRLRLPDVIAGSYEKLKNKPVTLGHPKDDVTIENADSLTVGLSSNDVTWDGYNCFVTITITNKKAIEAIEKKEVEAISCGYDAEVIDKVGNWQGVDYDQQVINIINYNHIALVKRGRAGDSVIFKVGDSIDNFEHNKKDNNNMKTIILDGVQCEASEEVIAELKKTKDAKETAVKSLEELKKEKDALSAKLDAVNEELKMMKEKDSAENIDKLVQDKLNLVETAKSFGCEVKTSDSSESIKNMVILKAFDSVDLKDKSDDYIEAMHDAAVSFLSKKEPKTVTSLDAKGVSEEKKSAYQKSYEAFYKKEG